MRWPFARYAGATALAAALLSLPGDSRAAGQVLDRWEPIGPYNGIVFALARDPFDAGLVLAGTYFGGLYRSRDSGLTWSAVPAPFSERTIFAISFDPGRPGTVYVATFQDGIYGSTDHGVSWRRRDSGITDANVQDVAVDPFDSNVVLAATYSGVFKSVDAGGSWAPSNGGLSLSAKTIAFDPRNEGVVYLGVLDRRGAFRSGDRGGSWNEFNRGMVGNDVQKLRFDLQTGTEAYATSSDAVAYRLPAGSDTWVRISDGLPPGPISDLIPHPFDKRILFAAAAYGVYVSTDGGQGWAQSYGFDPYFLETTFRLLADPVRGLIHAGNLNGTGVVVTSDFGQSWQPALEGMQNLFVGALTTLRAPDSTVLLAGSDRGLALRSERFVTPDGIPWVTSPSFKQTVFVLKPHPSRPEVVFAGTERRGVYKSTDWGATWTASADGIVPLVTYDLAQSPSTPDSILAATSSGLWASRDGGKNWSETPLTIPIVTALAADASRAGFFLMGTQEGKVYRSPNDGYSVVPAANGLPGSAIRALVIGPDRRLYCITEEGDVYTSANDGDLWTLLRSAVNIPARSLVVDPFTPSVVYLGTLNAGVLKSSDYGQTWAPKSLGMGPSAPIYDLDIDPANPWAIYATSWGRVYKSSVAGEFWDELRFGIPLADVSSLVIDRSDAQTLWIAVKDQGVYGSTDGGATWGRWSADLPLGGEFPLIQSRSNPFQLLAGPRSGGVYTSLDRGFSWRPTAAGMSLFIRGLAIDPRRPDTMYAGSLKDGVFRSTDGGSTWRNTGFVGAVITDLEVDPRDSSVIYVGTTLGVYRSADAGGTWFPVGPKNEVGYGVYVLAIEIDPTDSTVYVGSQDGIYKSRDRGNTWIPIHSGLRTRKILSLAIDPASPQTLYAGSVGEGVFASEDGGANWVPFLSGMFSKTVTSLAIDPFDHRVIYAGTEGGGVFRLARSEAPLPPPFTRRSFRMGFTSLPPTYDPYGSVLLYSALRTSADLIAHPFQEGIPWPEALLSSDYRTYPQHLRESWEFLRKSDREALPGHDIYLMINPLDTSYEGKLAPYWGERNRMPLPPPWDQYDFNDPNVKTAFTNFVIAAVEFFQPRYVAINIEANILLAKRYEKWQAFKELNAYVYNAVKQRYPNLKVFSTVNYEHLLGLHVDSRLLQERLGDTYPNVLENEVRALLMHSDLLALSTYPYMVKDNVVAEGYYDRALAMGRDLGMPLAVDQAGYISRDLYHPPLQTTLPGSEEVQANFVGYLLQVAHQNLFEFVNHFILFDYGTNYGTDPTTMAWAYTGLLNEDGTPKAAYAVWFSYLQLPHVPRVDVPPPETLFAGNVVASEREKDGVLFRLERGAVAQVKFLDADMVRVRFNPSGVFSARRTGAVAAPDLSFPNVSVVDAEDAIYLTTERLALIVHKKPFRVVALRPDGRVVSADADQPIGWNRRSGLIFDRKLAPAGERYLGLGLRGGPLDRRGQSLVMRNSDNGGYGELTQPLYSSTPFYYGARDGEFYGLFLDNPAEPFFDMDSGGNGTIMFGAQEGELDYYLFAGPEPSAVAKAFARLTGPAVLPAKWTLGYHQSRFGYRSWPELLDLAATFRELQIPADALYLDLDYMDRLQLFSWDPASFLDPVANNRELQNLGFRRVNILDPAVRVDDRLWPFLAASHFFLEDAAGDTVVNNIFLGDVSWFDFTRPAARAWFRDQLRVFLQTGVSGVWNDLNEPAANFMPQGLYDFGGQRRTDRQARNLYALQETSLTRETLLSLRPNERPFVLSRSGYPGIQRYAANWSGDTLSSFDSLRVSVQLSLHMALSGQIQFGHDVGGFFASPSPELFIRWLQFGSLTPFFRNHALDTTERREPWQFGEPYTSIAREVINQRYRLMPYLYTLFEEASRTGQPVLAPTFFHFPADPRTYAQDQEFMLGPYLLVAPVLEEGQRWRTVYLPAGSDWTDFHTGETYDGGAEVTVAAPLERIPIFVRDGAILAGGPLMQFVDQRVARRVNVDLYPGADRVFTLYEDDGISFDYRNGAFLRTRITTAGGGGARAVAIEPIEGTWRTRRRPWWISFHGSARPTAVTVNRLRLPEVGSRSELEKASLGWFYEASSRVLVVRLPRVPALVVAEGALLAGARNVEIAPALAASP